MGSGGGGGGVCVCVGGGVCVSVSVRLCASLCVCDYSMTRLVVHKPSLTRLLLTQVLEDAELRRGPRTLPPHRLADLQALPH